MSQQKLLVHVAKTLRELGIEFMLSGSLASSLQGEPRATHDIDLVVALARRDCARLRDAFPASGFYLSESAMREAVESQRMFNLLDITSGDKVDFWILTREPFDQSRFARRGQTKVDGVVVDVSRPEDTILAKLLWARQSGGSEKQFGDALGVYEVNFGQLDFTYIAKWVASLEVGTLWQRLVEQAEPLES